MAAPIAEVRRLIARRLGEVKHPLDDSKTLRAGDLLRDAINPPIALVGPDDPFILPHLTQGNSTSRVVNLKVHLFVSRASERAGQILLDAFLDSDAIETAIEADWPEAPVHFAEVKSVGDYGELVVGEMSYLGCTYSVMVVAS